MDDRQASAKALDRKASDAIDHGNGQTGTEISSAERGRPNAGLWTLSEPIRVGDDRTLSGRRTLEVYWLGYWIPRLDESGFYPSGTPATAQLMDEVAGLIREGVLETSPGTHYLLDHICDAVVRLSGGTQRQGAVDRPKRSKETTMIIDTADLDPTSSYKLLIGSVLPRAIAWVSTSSTSGVGNIAPVSFFTVVGRFPPVLSITLQPRSDGVTLKDTFVNIRDTGEFVVNIASIGQADAVHRSAYEFDTDVDEFEALGLEKAASEVISVPRIAGAPISFECVVDRIIPMPPLPDHVVWGRVKRIHVRDDLYLSRGRIDVGALGVFGGSPPSTRWSTTSSPPRSPDELVRRVRLPACRPARRARHGLLAHRHGRMVTVGRHEGGGEMTQSLNGFRITRTPPTPPVHPRCC